MDEAKMRDEMAQRFTKAVHAGVAAFIPAFLDALQKQGLAIGMAPPSAQLGLVDRDGKPV